MRQENNRKQNIVLIMVDTLVLLELMFSIYLGYQNPENITAVFLKTYIPVVIVTILIGRFFIRRLGSEEAKA
ncbi:MAG: hypothetical protein ABII68_04945 [Pseudomonadota bacterium]